MTSPSKDFPCEAAFQQWFAELMTRHYPHVTWWHTPNEARRSWTEGRRQRAGGMRAGVPDCCVLLRWGSIGFIELKNGDKKPTAQQALFRDEVQAQGFDWYLCRNRADVYEVLKRWKELKKI